MTNPRAFSNFVSSICDLARVTSLRKFLAFTMLAALLLGNVGSFVHVGQHQATSSLKLQDASSVAAVEASCSCCLPQSGDCETQPDGESLPLEQEHDSDSCSICQAFYHARAGISYPAPAVINCGCTVDFLPVCTSPAPIAIVIAGFDSRGPPSAA